MDLWSRSSSAQPQPGVAGPAPPAPLRHLADLVLSGSQGLDDGFQLNLPSLDALLQLRLLLLQSVQLRLGPVQVVFLGLEVRLLRLDLRLQRGNLK